MEHFRSIDWEGEGFVTRSLVDDLDGNYGVNDEKDDCNVAQDNCKDGDKGGTMTTIMAILLKMLIMLLKMMAKMTGAMLKMMAMTTVITGSTLPWPSWRGTASTL